MATASALACSKEESKPVAPPAPEAAAAVSAAPSSAPAPGASAAPIECPKGASGEGTFMKPCEGKGRMMDVAWTGKMDEKGPHFRVTNKSPSVILYGRMAVYFYNKAGKQLDAKDASGKAIPFHTCGGSMFGGVMKAGEKAVLTFSCVTKDHVPDGTAAIEAEMPMVGFTDASEKKVTAYWRNNDLSPDARKKGGVK
jgi:hypothetical protein